MYQLLPNNPVSNEITCVRNLDTHLYIPFDPANTDYQNFKKDLTNGVPCNDATGTAMTQEQITAFLETLK